jgi:hypothetical protein
MSNHFSVQVVNSFRKFVEHYWKRAGSASNELDEKGKCLKLDWSLPGNGMVVAKMLLRS